MQDTYKLANKATNELEARDSELVALMASLASWRNRHMSRKDRLFFTELYRAESTAITDELMRREEVGA